MIAIVDYNMGNVASIRNMLNRAGYDACLTAEVRQLQEAAGIILPGVGAFDTGMRGLIERDLVDPLRELGASGKPFLGICLGMQLLARGSEEGDLPGLGLLPLRVVRFPKIYGDRHLKVPHMGWKSITPTRLGTGLSATVLGSEANRRFYFVHSYYAPVDTSYCLATAAHGFEFAAVIGKDNVVGTQFHPEKSHKFGLEVMSSFAKFCYRPND